MILADNGILFLGLPEEDVDMTMLPNFDADLQGIADIRYLENWSWANQSIDGCDDLMVQETNRNGKMERLIGYQLGASGFKWCIELIDLQKKEAQARKHFIELFDKEPKIYLIHYQRQFFA